MKCRNEIEKALRRESWISFYDLALTKPVGRSESKQPEEAVSNVLWPDEAVAPTGLSAVARILGYDIVTYLDSQFSERQERLNLSARQMEGARTDLISQRLIKDVWLGKSLMLAPTAAFYEGMGLQSPYKRNVSDIHSWFCWQKSSSNRIPWSNTPGEKYRWTRATSALT